MHLILANDLVEKVIDQAKQGQIVELSGYLIKATQMVAGNGKVH